MKIKLILLSIIHLFCMQTQSLFASHNHEIYNVPGHYDVNSIPGHHDVNFSNNPNNQQWDTTVSDVFQCPSTTPSILQMQQNAITNKRKWDYFLSALERQKEIKEKTQLAKQSEPEIQINNIINELGHRAIMIARSNCYHDYNTDELANYPIHSLLTQLSRLKSDYQPNYLNAIEEKLQKSSKMTLNEMLVQKYNEGYQSTKDQIMQQEFEKERQIKFAREQEIERKINNAIGQLSQLAIAQGLKNFQNSSNKSSLNDLKSGFCESLLTAVETELQTNSQMSLDQMLQESYEKGYTWEQGKTLRKQTFNEQHKLHEAAIKKMNPAYEAYIRQIKSKK